MNAPAARPPAEPTDAPGEATAGTRSTPPSPATAVPADAVPPPGPAAAGVAAPAAAPVAMPPPPAAVAPTTAAPTAATGAAAPPAPPPPAASVAAPIEPPAPAVPPAPWAVPVAASPALPGRWLAAGGLLLAVLSTAALVLAWGTQQRVKSLEQLLVKRQEESSGQAGEARTLARQAETTAREGAARLALLEARVSETTMQRGQLEELIQSLSRSRDENVLAEVDAAIRVAMQQTAITGSAEPLVLTLKQVDERLARHNQPRLERVRRAVAQDLERARTAGVADLTVLTIRLDEVIRQIDELPLLSAPGARRGGPGRVRGDAVPVSSAPAVERGAAAPAAAAASVPPSWSDGLWARWAVVAGAVWQEIRGLVRVTRIDEPEAMLVAPEQAYFLRENLKLRLLNARLALLSRQFDTAQADLRDAQAALDRYFDASARRVGAASELLRQITSQARLVTVPRPDATLAAVATAAAGR